MLFLVFFPRIFWITGRPFLEGLPQIFWRTGRTFHYGNQHHFGGHVEISLSASLEYSVGQGGRFLSFTLESSLGQAVCLLGAL
jgi:hypothetical protein